MAKKEREKKQAHSEELAKIKRERKQSRNLKSLEDLSSNAQNQKKQKMVTPASPLISPPLISPPKRKDPIEELETTLRSSKPKVVMATGTISLEITTAEGKKGPPLIPDSIFTLEFRGATGLVKIPANEVRKILQALGVKV